MRYLVFVLLVGCSAAPVAAIVDAGAADLDPEAGALAAPPQHYAPPAVPPVVPVSDAGALPDAADAGTGAPVDAAPARQGACVLADASVIPCPTPVGHIIMWQYDGGGFLQSEVCGYGGWGSGKACPTGHACTVFVGGGMAAGTCAP